MRRCERQEARDFEPRLDEVGVAAEAGEVDRERQARPEFGKIGLSTVLWTKLGVTLLIVRSPPSPISSESRRNGIALQTSSGSRSTIGVQRSDDRS